MTERRVHKRKPRSIVRDLRKERADYQRWLEAQKPTSRSPASRRAAQPARGCLSRGIGGAHAR